MKVSSENVLQIANGLPMWIACGIAVSLIVVQAVIFLRNSYTAAKNSCRNSVP